MPLDAEYVCDICTDTYVGKHRRPGRDGKYRCPECSLKRNRQQIAAEYRSRQLLRDFGMHQQEYDRLFLEQSGVCAICKERELHKDLAVDHDHKTKRVRGLLCSRCNIGLSHFKDSSLLLSQASAYIARSNLNVKA